MFRGGSLEEKTPATGASGCSSALEAGRFHKAQGVIDYSTAADLADEVRAFAVIESGEDEHAVGDGGQAFGLLQMHPATFKRYYGLTFPADVRDTWTEAQIKACAGFLSLHNWIHMPQAMRDLIVMSWNLGESAVFVHGKRNPEYLARWLATYDQIKKASGEESTVRGTK
jgi:hypothetical protein